MDKGPAATGMNGGGGGSQGDGREKEGMGSHKQALLLLNTSKLGQAGRGTQLTRSTDSRLPTLPCSEPT